MHFNLFQPLFNNFRLQSVMFRRAFRVAFAVFISVLIYRYFGLTQGFWVPLTVVIVMQTTTAATLRKGWQRLAGTIIGILIGSLLVMKVQNPIILDCLLVLSLFLAYYLKAFNQINYGIFVVPITIMVVFLVSDLSPQQSNALIIARVYDTLLGAIIAILCTLVILPNSLKKDVQQGIKNLYQSQYEYLSAILLYTVDQTNKSAMDKARQNFQLCLSENRRFYSDWVYELWLRLKSDHQHAQLLETSEKMGQFLFSLQAAAKSNISPNLQQELQLILKNIADHALTASQNFTQFISTLDQSISKLQELNKTSTHKNFITLLLVDLESYRTSLQTFVSRNLH